MKSEYQIKELTYSDLPFVDKGNIESMRAAQEAAYVQIENQLADYMDLVSIKNK